MSKQKETNEAIEPESKLETQEVSVPIRCFVIMPFSSSEGYERDHFTRVYNHIIKPACEKAGVIPERTDDGFESGFIPTKMLKMLTEYELAICDMSAVNANVFYELGVRQSFDLPVCLIKDEKSRRMFDVQGFASIEYHSSLRYDYVIDAVDKIARGLRETYEKQQRGEIVNSIKHFLEMKVAQKPEQVVISEDTAYLIEEIRVLKSTIDRQILNLSNGGSINETNEKFLRDRDELIQILNPWLERSKESMPTNDLRAIAKIFNNSSTVYSVLRSLPSNYISSAIWVLEPLIKHNLITQNTYLDIKGSMISHLEIRMRQ